MSRVDGASRIVPVPPMDVYQAFTDPRAMEQWIPPAGMVARMLQFDFREGGSYRMRLTYVDSPAGRGKTADDSDEVQVRLVSITAGKEIEQEVVFEARDPSFAGVMRMIWTFEPEGQGTLVTVRAENVPEGIRPEDHRVGMNSTLENLDAFLSRGS
jgi:uncharacterized protein YndB with AHSA1/START domain